MVPDVESSIDDISAQVAGMASLHVQLTVAPTGLDAVTFQCATNPGLVTLPSEVKTMCKYPVDDE